MNFEIVNEYNLINDMFNFCKHKSNNFEKELNDNQKISKYSEKDLDEWMRKLKNLKIQLTEINESDLVTLKSDRRSYSKRLIIIYFATIIIVLIAYYINSIWIIKESLLSNTKFIKINGPIQLSEDGYAAEHNGSDFVHGLVRFDKTYSKGIHHMRLSLEKFSSSNTFIGIIEANTKQEISSLYGWFIGDKQVFYNIPGEYKIFYILRK
jgi:hypothetical protein